VYNSDAISLHLFLSYSLVRKNPLPFNSPFQLSPNFSSGMPLAYFFCQESLLTPGAHQVPLDEKGRPIFSLLPSSHLLPRRLYFLVVENARFELRNRFVFSFSPPPPDRKTFFEEKIGLFVFLPPSFPFFGGGFRVGLCALHPVRLKFFSITFPPCSRCEGHISTFLPISPWFLITPDSALEQRWS